MLVAAASDLIEIQGALAQGFEAQSGAKVRFTFGASGNLAQQVANGAPYDVFLSADEQRVKDLAPSGDPDFGGVEVYAQGRLALWSKTGKIANLTALSAPGILHVAIANPAHAPYGIAAKQALENAGLWKSLEKKIVYGESVRQALEYAESGNADAVITAWSLVIHRKGILIPADLHNPIRQAGAALKGGKNPEGGAAFLRFLLSPQGRALLSNAGFDMAPARQP